MVILELLHQANLCLLLYGLMGRSILTDTEGIVRPDELHRELHEGGHAHCWLHVVGEDEERTAGSYDPTMQGHTDAETGHRQLSYPRLEEGTTEVSTAQSSSLLEEAIGLIGVREVGGGYDHVLYLSS